MPFETILLIEDKEITVQAIDGSTKLSGTATVKIPVQIKDNRVFILSKHNFV